MSPRRLTLVTAITVVERDGGKAVQSAGPSRSPRVPVACIWKQMVVNTASMTVETTVGSQLSVTIDGRDF
jgi:hypothetical protein